MSHTTFVHLTSKDIRLSKFSRKYELFLYINVFRKLKKSLVIAMVSLKYLKHSNSFYLKIRKIFTICHQTSGILRYLCNLSGNTVRKPRTILGHIS